MNSGVLLQRWRTFGTDASYSLNVVERRSVKGRGWPVRWYNGPDGGCRCCCCFYLRVKEFVYVAGGGRGSRWRSGRVPSVAPPLLHATGACLLGLNPGIVDTEFRSGLGWWQTGCNAMRQVGRGDCLSVCRVRPPRTACHGCWTTNKYVNHNFVFQKCLISACFSFRSAGWDEFGDKWSSSKTNGRAGYSSQHCNTLLPD